ncbi:MAG: hypothetical protein ACKO2V_11975 [Snowella sp.]
MRLFIKISTEKNIRKFDSQCDRPMAESNSEKFNQKFMMGDTAPTHPTIAFTKLYEL